MSDKYLDEFVTVAPGEAYRLFPFGAFYKGGRKREITPELASRFRLPHFKPPIKLGGHADPLPAGGHIVALEVREDGLYAIPEINEQGAQAIIQGAYRYHSPEVIWEGGGLENPATGETIEGPLIVGDALLHTPHLGEAAALYTSEIVRSEMDMSENVSIPTNLWDRFVAWLDRTMTEPEPASEPEAPQVPEDYSAALAERDQYKAELERIRLEAEHKARLDSFAAKIEGLAVEQNAEMLASMTDEQADWVIAQLAALSAQVKTNDVLTQEIGSSKEPEAMGAEAVNKAIEAYAAEHKLTYPQAFDALRRERPELFK